MSKLLFMKFVDLYAKLVRFVQLENFLTKKITIFWVVEVFFIKFAF